MILEEFSLEGYRCFFNPTIIPFHNLTVLIGENDSGKSTVLKGLNLFLSKFNQQDDDFYNLGDVISETFTLSGKFKIDVNDASEVLKPFIIDEFVEFKKVYTKAQAFRCYSNKKVLEDDELENYLSLNANETRDLLNRLGLPSKANQEERRAEVKAYLDGKWEELPKKISEVEVNFNTISQFLPYFQYYGSHDYGNPQLLVKKTLENIIRSRFYDENNELKSSAIRNIRGGLLQKLNSSIEQNLLSKIQKYNSKIKKIQGRIDIDFTQGLSFQGLELDEGQGFKLVDQKGEGSKKRLFLSILEWDKEIQINNQQNRPVIRAYDEPDLNLHYEAQRKMFYAISEVVNNVHSNVQAVIATHSLTMIDRAPSHAINHIIQTEGISTVQFLQTNGDADIKAFLNQIAIIGGIKNSSIFYEKCFLIVEGDSEEASIGKIYKKLYNRTLSEDGIVLINLQTNGAWYNFLKLLRNNKKHCTVMLLDTDTQNAECGASVTVAKLNELGFDADFLNNQVFFAGVQEFEDLYPDRRIRDVFNYLYPKPTKRKWTLRDIEKIRVDYQKISKGFKDETLKYIKHHKTSYKKPEFAMRMVEIMTAQEIQAIPVLSNLFIKIENILK